MVWFSSDQGFTSPAYAGESLVDDFDKNMPIKSDVGLERLVHVCVLNHFSHAQLSATPWTIPPGSSVYGILQARILDWVASPSSRGSSLPRDCTYLMSLALAGEFLITGATCEV